MRYSDCEKIVGNYIVLKTFDTNNSYLIDKCREYNVKGDIKKDVFGRVSKMFKYVDKHDLILDYVSILNKDSRKSKIDSFLSSLYDDVAESFKFGIGSLNYDVEIILQKNTKGITNKCVITKNVQPFKEFDITDFDKSIKYISKLISKDRFNFKEFLNSKFISKYTKKEIVKLQETYDKLLYKYDNIKWSTCRIDVISNKEIDMEFLSQKGKKILKVDVRKAKYHKNADCNYPRIKVFKSVNKDCVSCDTFNDLDEALKEF